MPVGFDQFVVASSARLVRTARLLLGSASEAEDVAQETLIVMHQHWTRLRDEGAAEAYALRTLVRLARRHLRSARVQREIVMELGEHTPLTPTATFDPREDDLPAALAALPTRQREAVVLRYYLDLSIADTARIMRCTPGTVKSQASKALTSMRRTLQHPDRPTSQAGQP